MKRADGVVIAQSSATAGYPSMPIAAAKAGADLILQVHDIGGVLASIAQGAPLPSLSEGTVGADGLFAVPRMDRSPAGEEPMEISEAADSHRDGRCQTSPNRSIDSATGRAEAARRRVDELRCRRQDLAAGLGATAQTVAS